MSVHFHHTASFARVAMARCIIRCLNASSARRLRNLRACGWSENLIGGGKSSRGVLVPAPQRHQCDPELQRDLRVRHHDVRWFTSAGARIGGCARRCRRLRGRPVGRAGACAFTFGVAGCTLAFGTGAGGVACGCAVVASNGALVMYELHVTNKN